jgi:hypothetical protein
MVIMLVDPLVLNYPVGVWLSRDILTLVDKLVLEFLGIVVPVIASW